MNLSPRFGVFLLWFVWVTIAAAAAPKIDTAAVIRKSYDFLRNKEPVMTETEYALYERIVDMIAVQPDFALNLLQNMLSGKEQKSPAFDFLLGSLYFSNKRPDLAEKHFRAAVQRLPGFVRAWSNLGMLYYSEGRYVEAMPCLTTAIQGGDRDARTLGLLAYCLDQAGQPVAAELAYMQAVSLDPTNVEWISALLGHYLDQKKYAEAESLVRQLIRIHPDQRQNWLVHARVLIAQDRTTEAVGVLEAASALNLLDAEGWLMLAERYAEQKRFADALVAFNRLAALNAKLGAARLADYAGALISEGRLAEAGKVIDAFDPAETPATVRLLLQCRADLAFARRDWPAAIKALDQLIQQEPLNGRALLGRGHAYKNAGDLARAEFNFELLARVPEYAYEANIELADAALKTRRPDRSLECLRAALSLKRTVALQEYVARLELLRDAP